MSKRGQMKTIVVVILAILAVIVLVQNTESVTTKLLFMEVSMPRAILLLVTLVIGFAAGLVAAGIWGRKK